MTTVGNKRIKSVEAWGSDTAASRYGGGKCHQTPKQSRSGHESSEPQKLGDASNLRDPAYDNDTKDGWLRGKDQSKGHEGYWAGLQKGQASQQYGGARGSASALREGVPGGSKSREQPANNPQRGGWKGGSPFSSAAFAFRDREGSKRK